MPREARSRLVRRPWLGAAALLAALAALTPLGCGGESDPPAPNQEGEPREVVIEAEDGAFDPQTIYESVAPGVVTVRSVFEGGEAASLFEDEGGGLGQGSGFVISDAGEIVTNAHVVTDGETAGDEEISPADEVFVQFADRNQVSAEVVGFDPFADVALLEVDPEGLELAPLRLGSAEGVEVGDPVAAIGSPFGQQQSLSIGVVSATDRSVQSLTRFTIDGAIQTDASINPGNSGGPLLDAEGRVIGLNQQIRTGTGANEGVGFAVPIELAERSVAELRETGETSYAFLGVTTLPVYPQLAERLDLDVGTGALIDEVTPGSPADEAGLRGGDDEIEFQGIPVTTGGDVIVAVDGERLIAENDLPRIVSLLDPGQEVTLEVIRGGGHREIDVTLGARSSDLE